VAVTAKQTVMHVSDCYLPRLGGIEVQVAELARIQAAAGHGVHVVTATPAHTPDPAGEEGDAPRLHRIVAPLPFELPVHPRAGRVLARLLAGVAPDVVHVHVGAVSPFAWTAVAQAVRAGVPTVVSVHSMWDPFTSGVYRMLDVARWRTWPIIAAAVSTAAARRVQDVLGDRAEVRVIPNGFDPAAWPAAPAAPHTGQPMHLVAVGRLAPRKQPFTLLHALRSANAAPGLSGRIRVTVAGDGPAEPWMRRYLKRHHMTRWVQLTGRVDRRHLPALLATADVFLAPARREAFGLAALEARSVGIPVIARADTGVADFITTERDGLLATGLPGLTAALIRLLTDTELRCRIATHNRATPPARFAWPQVKRQLDQCYTDAQALLAQTRISHDVSDR
jgi:glycosyltransferase involved in cell wall biosynthesis